MLCAGVAAALLAIHRAIGWEYWLWTGLLGFVALAGCGILVPAVASAPYAAWNRAAHGVGRAARYALCALCFLVVVVAAGKACGRSTRSSGWAMRRVSAEDVSSVPFPGEPSGGGSQNWIRLYVRWAVKTKQWRALCALPFLVLLRSVEEEEEAPTFPTRIYTLF